MDLGCPRRRLRGMGLQRLARIAPVRGRRHSEAGLEDLDRPRHPDPQPLMLDLDLGQTRLVQEIRQLANDLPVETLALRVGLGLRHPSIRHGARGATSGAMAWRASSYPKGPKPQITPVASGDTKLLWRMGSRLYTLERWISTSGTVSIFRASCSASDVWV